MTLALDAGVLWTFTLMWLAVVPTPGANSLMVTHLAVTRPAGDVALALLGNLAGILLLAALALLGWAALLEAFPWARLAVTIFGALYLVYFGLRLIGRSMTPSGVPGPRSAPDGTPAGARRMIMLGFVTALSNAQAIIFITSIFAVSGILNASLATGLVAIIIMIGCNAAYLGLIAWLFQRAAVRLFYQRFRRVLEASVGTLFVFFGGRLLVRALIR